MNEKGRMILESYRRERPHFLMLEQTIDKMLKDIVNNLGVEILAVEHRVKTEESLAGKLYRKGDGYLGLDDITDILGARIICFFSDDVDKIGNAIEERFVIDRENSADKRADMRVDAFGYLSLHYICSLPFGAEYPEEICGRKFEIQIRTGLQHIWAAINHDIGYKTKFGVPRVVTREFSRLAGLLELADDEFIRLRDGVDAYTTEIHEKIINDSADDVNIDMISLKEYMFYNIRMRAFLKRLADIEGSDIINVDPEGYIEQLNFLGKHTLGDLSKMLSENEELAFSMAYDALSGSELDIISSSVGLRYLTKAELLNKGYSLEKVIEFMMLTSNDKEYSKKQAQRLFNSNKRDED